jgi:hypothetical protein
MDELTFQAELEKARVEHPFIAEEYERLQCWCAVCLGEDVAKVGGLTV